METKKYMDVLNKGLQVALGCTEPIAIAFATALARKYVKGDKALLIKVYASRNVIKNAMGVNIPGTNSSGINLAAALGSLAKDADKKLEVLSGLTVQDIENARSMVSDGVITVEVSDSDKLLYIEVVVETEISKAKVVIEDSHTNVILIEIDGKSVEKQNSDKINLESLKDDLDFMNLDSIWEFVQNVDINQLDIIRESINLNKDIGEEGLKNPHGLEVGRTILLNVKNGLLSDDIATYAMALTAAGSDARMAGSLNSVMSNSGSGNQGILATLPVIAVAEKLKAEDDKIVRGVLLSHLITIYIKSKFGILSALCGATIAGLGASCGITYILGGGLKEIKCSIQNMLGNVTGMFCDGAKPGCALKVSTCANAAVQSALIAMRGISVNSTEGIVEENPEKTIENLCRLANQGTTEVDKIILDIMLNKGDC